MTDHFVAGRSMSLEACISCGVEFCMPSVLRGECVRVGSAKSFYCPNGHAMSFSESAADKLRRERDLLRQRVAEKDDEITRQKLAAEKAKKETERLKKRIGGGVCPCCSRHFSNLERHMKTKHNDNVVEFKREASK